MSPKLKDGTYHISIVVDNKEKYLDLSESNPTPGTPIIGFTPDNDKTNQKWVLVVKKSGTMGSITSLVKESASCATTGSKQGDKVDVGSSQLYELVETENETYRIKYRNKNLVWRLPNNQDGTQVELATSGLGNDEWSFELL